jgi:prophage regulatory protein
MSKRLPEAELILKHERRRLVPLSEATVWRMERRNEFPRRIRVSSGRVAWRRSEIERWLEHRQRALPTSPSTSAASPT